VYRTPSDIDLEEENRRKGPLARQPPHHDYGACRAGAANEVIQDIVGHVLNRMLRHFSHVRMAAKRQAWSPSPAAALSGWKQEPRCSHP